MLEYNYPGLSLFRQCELLGVNRSSYYYKPVAATGEELTLMQKIDEIYLKHPYYGSRRITVTLNNEHNIIVNRKRVLRLMKLMGIEAIYPRPKTTIGNKQHQKYPYLLKDIDIDKPNQVWAADITYIPMSKGFLYLVAIIDWFSRYIISWELSNTLDSFFCLEALERGLGIIVPDICNTDQGSQFTGNLWTQCLSANNVKISMDGKGRAIDNIIIERFFRSLKYEEIYINPCDTGSELRKCISGYIHFYNTQRPHQSLDYQTPELIYQQ